MDDSRCVFRRQTLATVLLLASSVCFGGSKLPFDIPGNAFPTALLEFYRQSQVEILFLSTPDLYRIHTAPLKGKFEPRDALNHLLAGTGMVCEFESDHSAIIKRSGEDVIYFDIPAGAASERLNEWSRQAKVQLLFDFNAVRGMTTHEIKGSMSRIEALLRMISGLSLSANQINESTYTIELVKPHDAPPRFVESRRRNPEAIQTGVEEVLIASNRSVGLSSTLEEPRLIDYDRTEIEASGATSIQEFAGTIPQVWGGGPNEYSQIGREGQTNPDAGTGFNYRSLGASSAVVLVDGIRPARSGTEAGYWDISLVPLSAIERVEIAPERAANRFGLDAISAVVNFATRSGFEGAETQAEIGGMTSGGGLERDVTQLMGTRWGSIDVSLILNYYDRDVVPATVRPQATSDLRRWGGTNWNSPFGYPGTLVAGTGETWAINGVSNGKPVLGPEGSSNSYDVWQFHDILPRQQRSSALGHLSSSLGDARLWSSVWLSNRHATGLEGATSGTLLMVPSTNPGYTNPLGGGDPVFVEYGVANLLGPRTFNSSALAGSAATGVALEEQAWNLELSAQTGFERDRVVLGGYPNSTALQQAVSSTTPGTTVNPFLGADAVDPAVLAGISQIYYYQSYSRLQSVDGTANRTLHTLAAGNGTLSFGAQYRRESFESDNPSTAPSATRLNAKRGISSVYTSIALPLVGHKQAVPLTVGLDLFVGARYERYSDDGESMTSPSVSLAWSPVSALTFTGGFRRAFRPPALTETSTSSNLSETVPTSDGRTALGETGGNPALRAERARISTGGLDFRPRTGVLLSATYYDIVSSGRVFQPTFSPDPDRFNGRLVPNPTSAQIAAVCAESRYVGGITASCAQGPDNLIMDLRLQSLELLHSSGTDWSARFVTERWKLRFDGSYLFSYRGTGANGIVLEHLNTLNNPVDLRARAAATRIIGPLTITVAGSFTDSYRDSISKPQRRIGSWTTLDFVAAYRPTRLQVLEGAEVVLRIRNLMNRQPPFANNGAQAAGWDPANGGSLAGRAVSSEIHWTW